MNLKSTLFKGWYDELTVELVPYQSITTFSGAPGIYFVGYTGTSFPLSDIGPDRVVYIGKTEDSQRVRDAKTHFASGETGRSTLRRSIGAMLKNTLNLTAIPRNGKASRQAINCYEFEGEGEQRVTTWMRGNLSLAFKPGDETAGDLAEIEKALIRYRYPILNIQNNPKKSELLIALRKICREEAKAKIARN